MSNHSYSVASLVMIIGSLFNDETLTYPCRTITDIGQDVDQYSITLFPEYAMRDEKYRFGGLKANYNPKNISKIGVSILFLLLVA